MVSCLKRGICLLLDEEPVRNSLNLSAMTFINKNKTKTNYYIKLTLLISFIYYKNDEI